MIFYEVVVQCEVCHDSITFSLDENSNLKDQITETLNLSGLDNMGKEEKSTWIEKDGEHYCSNECLKLSQSKRYKKRQITEKKRFDNITK